MRAGFFITSLSINRKFYLGDFNAKVGREIFSNQQLDRRVFIRIVMIMVLD